VQEFLKSLTVKDDVERYLGLFKAFWLAVWMSMDHIQWLQKAGYLKLADLKKIDEVGRRCGSRSRHRIQMTRVALLRMHVYQPLTALVAVIFVLAWSCAVPLEGLVLRTAGWIPHRRLQVQAGCGREQGQGMKIEAA